MHLGIMDKFPVLTREEEIDLVKKMQQGSKLAREKLICSNLRFVLRIADEYSFIGVPIEDLVMGGITGLIDAIDRFSLDYGVKVITYASLWIRQAIQITIHRQFSVVQFPVKSWQLNDGRVKYHLSLDESIGDSKNDDNSFIDNLKSNEIDMNELIEQWSIKDMVTKEMNNLTSREKLVIEKRFGFNGYEEETLESISKELKCSRENVRLIEEKAKNLLKRRLRGMNKDG